MGSDSAFKGSSQFRIISAAKMGGRRPYFHIINRLLPALQPLFSRYLQVLWN